ncbi:MAG: helix-turn-helix domain-containing protein [Salinivirgaceae bacterium]|nr:helix-turn-helix domain-containing protein [Salinivirgaceae bacterium]MDY0280020.1 helix-turn-helix domain-containing protein [Salinivirgaceae bacterium]
MNSLILRLSISCLFLISLYSDYALSQPKNPQDSIREIIPTLQGEAKLQALTDLYALTARGNDVNVEISALYDVIIEAGKQGNASFEGQSRAKLVLCYYNYDMSDSLVNNLPAQLEFMAKHGQWDYYYNSWDAKIELFLYLGKIQSALNEAQAMYNDAKNRQNSYGLGVSSHALGMIYQTQQRYDLAEKSFTEAVEQLKKEEDISLLLNTYNIFCETLDATKKYDKILAIAKEWKETIDTYKNNAEKRGITPQLSGRYMYCYLALTLGHLYTGDTNQAKYFLNLAEESVKGRKKITQLKLLQIQSRFYEHLGQHEKALAYADSNYQILIEFEDTVSALTTLESKARILRKSGKGMESALLYEQVMPAKDSLRDLEMAAQLDELRTIYEVDKLILEKKISETRLFAFIAISLFLLLLLLVYMFYARRLRHKNRILYEKIQNAQQAEIKIEKTLEQAPENTLSKEQLLFRSLNKLLTQKQLFINPKLGRKELADAIGTNVTYLADAIKECAHGMTVSEYLNRVRLIYAGNVLVENPDLPVDAVGDDCGFTSRSTFYRLFRDYYGMSPAEFRSISKEKVKKMVL